MSDQISPSISDFEENRSLTPASDYEAFRPSVSPRQWDEEDDGEQLWEVEGVVGEETNIHYKTKYEVKWANWQRANGTSTTWENILDGNDNLIEAWKKKKSKERKEAARLSFDINMQRIPSYLPHDIHTAENAEAYREKLKLWVDHNSSKPDEDWNDEVEQLKKQRDTNARNGTTPGKKRKRSRESGRLSQIGEEGSSNSVGTTANATGRLKMSASPSLNLHRTPSTGKARLPFVSKVEKQWNEAAERAGAAAIRIVNEVDDEEHPPIVEDFLYLESSRIYDDGVLSPEAHEFLSGCECNGLCNSRTLLCICQSETQCYDIAGTHTRAYDSKGLFLFTDEGEVMECNERCSCSERCGNRVAQQPRDFPVEIFKTSRLGWGVRAGVNIPKGKVLGLYTGHVIERQKVETLEPPAPEYTFALDLRDRDPMLQGQYSINAYAAGNWTRFVNHSCDPTAKIYSVIFDTVRQANMPNIAFVAWKAIPAGTEITIDYDPAKTLAAALAKGKWRPPRRRQSCLCGSTNCRGWL